MSTANEPYAEPDNYNDLPMQPTGSGVADLEVAYEQMKLSEEEASGTVRADDEEAPARRIDDVEAESEGHPS